MICYDKGMAVYIVIFLFWVVWMGIGVSRRLFYDRDEDESCDDLTRYMNFSIAIGYTFMTLVSFAFCCSLLCVRRSLTLPFPPGRHSFRGGDDGIK